MTQANTPEKLMKQITTGAVDLVSYEAICSDRLVRVHSCGTAQQHMEALERSDYRVAVPLADTVTVAPLEDSAA